MLKTTRNMYFYPFFSTFLRLQVAILVPETRLKQKTVIQGLFVNIKCIWTFLALGNLNFSSRLSYQSKNKMTQLAKDGNKWRKTFIFIHLWPSFVAATCNLTPWVEKNQKVIIYAVKLKMAANKCSPWWCNIDFLRFF